MDWYVKMTGETITFKDLLNGPLTVDGVALEANIECIVRKCGRNSFNIEYFDIKDLYLSTEVHGLIKFDLPESHLLYRRFVNAAEQYALKRAALTPEYQYDEIEEYGA